MPVSPAIGAKVEELRRRAAQRDADMWRVTQVLEGNAELVWPQHFSTSFPKQILANLPLIIAQDMAENIAPLPALNCSSGRMVHDAEKRRANLKNKIGWNYWLSSRLAVKMKTGALHYVTYPFLAFYVEPDFDAKLPRICLEDSTGCYYDLDTRGDTRAFVRVWRDRAARLAAVFPEHASALLADRFGRRSLDVELEVVRYADTDITVLYVPGRAGLVLAEYANPVAGQCPYVVAERPGLSKARGQLDDVVWVQLARNVMAQLTLEAGKKSVQGPTVVPPEMVDMPIGSDAVWRVEGGIASVGRVRLDVPRDAFVLGQQLEQETRTGARYPATRTGTPEASVITGQGVRALQGTFDSQISTAQDVLGEALRRVTEKAYALDEALWPDAEKTINGTMAGETFHETYRAGPAISGDHSCDVTYGFAAGQSPAQAIVMMLQLRGDETIDRDTVRRNLPFALDAQQMQINVDVQKARDAAIAGLQSALAATGQLAAAGQDPSALLRACGQFIKGRQDGRSVEDLLEEVFTPPEQPAAEAGGEGGAELAGQPGPAAPPTAAPQAPLPGQPGGPGIQDLVAAMRSGRPVMNMATRRRTVAA